MKLRELKPLKRYSKKDYELLLKSGMMWEFYPEATGNYDTDVGQHRKKGKKP